MPKEYIDARKKGVRMCNAIALHWIIPKDKAAKKSAFKSEVFGCYRIEGCSYYLKFYPNQNGNAVIAFKFINEIKDIIDFELFFYIKSCGYRKELIGEHERDFIRKIGKTLPVKNEFILCSTKDLFDAEKHFFNENDELIIQCHGCIFNYELAPQRELVWRFKSGKKSMQPYYKVDFDKDITLIARNGSVDAHKWVLATRAKFFNDLYTSDEQLDVTELEMTDFDVDVVEIAVILCYDHTKVPEVPTLAQKCELLKFFDRYPIQSYKAELEDHMLTFIDETNVCLMAQAAIEGHANKLKKKCAKYLRICAQNNISVLYLDQLDEKFRLKVLKSLFLHRTQTL